jgi:hypothetical protein
MDATTVARELAAAVPAWAWKGAALLALALAADLALRRRAAALRHLVWSGSLVGVLALPLAQPFLPELAVPLPLGRQAVVEQTAIGEATAAAAEATATAARPAIAQPGAWSDLPVATRGPARDGAEVEPIAVVELPGVVGASAQRCPLDHPDGDRHGAATFAGDSAGSGPSDPRLHAGQEAAGPAPAAVAPSRGAPCSPSCRRC